MSGARSRPRPAKETVCKNPMNTCGRPFLIDFLERRSAPAPRADWAFDAPTPDLSITNACQRARLADHWTEAGLMEHASIAAFARFSLQLLSLGAPSDLIEDTNRALADETKHARLCFALASAYRGSPVGPGPLRIDGSLDGATPEVILRTVIREGCLGETQAALEAAHALSLCEDFAVAEVLETISNDEARHSELAWRFVHWLLTERPELHPVAVEEFALALADIDADRESGELSELRRFGVLDDVARARVRRRALGAVVGPCAEKLLEPAEDTGPGDARLRAANVAAQLRI